jgi:hypothetical protein
MVIVGFNLILFHAYTKIYAVNAGFIRIEKSFTAGFKAEPCIMAGLLVMVTGITIALIAFLLWYRESFGALIPEKIMRITIPATTLISVGVQLMFSGFFIDILKIKTKNTYNRK